LVDIEPGMPEESADESRTSAEASKAAIDSSAEIADTGGLSLAQVRLDMAMKPLLGIQIRKNKRPFLGKGKY
jgi:hypothetical protein